MEEKRKPLCCNCIHGCTQFKIGKLTHLHCSGPAMKKYYEEEEQPSAWESLRVFSDTCEEHEFKPAKTLRTEINKIQD
jgi:hypothetical protein